MKRREIKKSFLPLAKNQRGIVLAACKASGFNVFADYDANQVTQITNKINEMKAANWTNGR